MKDNDFVYRLAKPTDIEQIVSLFEICLGSEGGAPTVAFWNWKHNQNPGGVSPVILAWDGDKLIGIRAFMCFKFHNKNEIYKAYRPVDTATDPDYQGKGVFRNLTMSLIEALKEKEEKAFIFNTPNTQSKPGYLKMGWMEWGKPLLQVLPTVAFWRDNFKKNQTKLLAYDFSTICVNTNKNLKVCKDAAYYHWRYQQIPLQQYGMKEMHLGKDCYTIIYRQKKSKMLNEYRICDVIKNDVSTNDIPAVVFVRLFLTLGFGMISFTNNTIFWLSMKLKKNAPMITFRKINDHDASIPFHEIDWRIGELELF